MPVYRLLLIIIAYRYCTHSLLMFYMNNIIWHTNLNAIRISELTIVGVLQIATEDIRLKKKYKYVSDKKKITFYVYNTWPITIIHISTHCHCTWMPLFPIWFFIIIIFPSQNTSFSAYTNTENRRTQCFYTNYNLY